MQTSATERETRVSRILPPSEGATTQISLRMPNAILVKLDGIAEDSGHPRSDVIMHFLRWALQEYEAEQQASDARKAQQAGTDSQSGADPTPKR